MTSNPREFPSWHAQRAGLRFGDALTVSFQRYLILDAPGAPAIPKSLGALEPHEIASDRFILPLWQGEAIWLAVEYRNQSRELILRGWFRGEKYEFLGRSYPDSAGAIEVAQERTEFAAGFFADRRAFVRFEAQEGACSRVDFEVRIPKTTARATVELVNQETFKRLTGVAPPLHARNGDGYGDWRLP